MKRFILVVDVEDEEAETFERETERGIGEDGNLEIDGYAHYSRLVSVTRQPPKDGQYPLCLGHVETQHRDGQPPWCNHCGWTHGRDPLPAKRLGLPRG